MGLILVASCRPGAKPAASDAALTSGEPIQMAAGTSERRELTGGATEVFAVAANQDQLLRLSIDKGDLVLSTTLYGPTGTRLLGHVSQDFEIIELSFPAQVAGTYTIELRSLESAQAARQYELAVHPLTPVTELNQRDSEARQAVARAEMLRAKSLAASFREATGEFDRAALIWSSISDLANAARAALKSGDIYFLLGEYQESSKRYRDAEALSEKGNDWLAKARAVSQMARLQSYLGHNDQAQDLLTQALNLFKEHSADRDETATNAYGEALSNLAEVSYSKGNFVKSSDQLDSALKVLQHYRKGQARVHLFLGYISGSIGETEKAVEELSKARALYRSINDKIGEALAVRALGTRYSRKGKEHLAIDAYNKALETFRSAGDRLSEAVALNALGQSHHNLKEYSIAIDFYKKGLQRFQDIGYVEGASVSTFQIAAAYEASKDPDQALEYYERGLTLTRIAGNARDEVNALINVAKFYADQGLHKQAEALYQKVLKFYESIRDIRGQAVALNNYGEFLLQRGEKQRALDTYHRGLPLSEKVGEHDILISTFYGLARANLELGALEVALQFIQRSLDVIEDLRANVESPEFRVSYFSGVQQHYELCINILMQLEKLKPGQGFAAEALAVSERGRARLLIDLVTESSFNLRAGADPELLARERKLRGLLRAQAAYRIDLSSNEKGRAEIAEVDSGMVQLRVDYQAVLAELSRQQPRLFPLEQAPPLDVRRIQNELRGSETMLLEYSLGEINGYLWAVTSDSLKFYELPSRKSVEDAAREYYESLTARQETQRQPDDDYQSRVQAAENLLAEKATNLSRILLGPLAGQLETKRLLVVAEGALQYIPFDALPVPGPNNNTLLLETNEVVVLPSFSTLIAIRGKQNRSISTRKLVAVIADPVFGGSDARMQIDANSIEKGHFSRLIHASEEADAISAVAPWGTTTVAKGFEATRETAMSSDVSQYQILHFATHAFEDNRHPELSSVVLTLVDRRGEQTDGVMPLHDIYSLDLSAELTVLSACQTALGKDTRGEGLVGLTHGFMSAGSKSVVASLWKVDDRATAVLMANFYESMLKLGMSPAAALRSAKLRMMRDKNWNAPYYWAGFVVQGEYDNHIAVDQRTSLRFVLELLFLVGLIAAVLLVFQKRKRRFSARQSS
jgi:CHAT domain-containing protein/tetratricopeptide (TPR) repeat protein